MYLLNDSNELVDSHVYAKELFAEGFGFEAVTETEAEEALAMLYTSAIEQQVNLFMKQGDIRTSFMANYGVSSLDKKSLWKTIKEYFCKFIKEDSNFKDILAQILEAIASLIPGGKLIKALVKIIVRFLFGAGMKVVCP